MASKQKKQLLEFHTAIKDNNLETVKKRIQELGNDSLDVCRKEAPPRGTSLHLAAECASPQMLELVLSSGISVNIRQEGGHVVSGMTPLYAAVSAGKIENIKCLLSKNADVNVPDSDGLTPLHCACRGQGQGIDIIDVLKVLLDAGADVNKKDNTGQSPLQVGILRAPTEVSKYLVERGADVNVLDKDGQSTLHYATEWENGDLVKFLIEKGAQVNLQDNLGRSPLHVTKEDEIMQMLIKNGGDVTLRDKQGKPPIEGHIDTEKEEFKHLDAVLGRKHAELKQAGQPIIHSAKAKDVQEKFNNLAHSSEDWSGEVSRADLFSELQSKVKKCEVTDCPETATGASRKYKPSPLATAGVLSQLKATRKEVTE